MSVHGVISVEEMVVHVYVIILGGDSTDSCFLNIKEK